MSVESESGESSSENSGDHSSDWDLDVEEMRPALQLNASLRHPARLVHKIIFSMPAGTPPDKVLEGVRNFSREEFALKYRYLLALHTDEPHPHVHLVLKGMSEQGQRFNIRKTDLRRWRDAFAGHLRQLGVPASATHRHVRGATGFRAPDGIYRARLRGDPNYGLDGYGAAGGKTSKSALQREHDSASTAQRARFSRAWVAIGDILIREGQPELAANVRQFVDEMPAATSGMAMAKAKDVRPQRARRIYR